MNDTSSKHGTTRIDLPQKRREAMIDLLNAQLADTIDLRYQVKQAHWNVKGPHFIALHELFDKFYAGPRRADRRARRTRHRARRRRARHGADRGEVPACPRSRTTSSRA